MNLADATVLPNRATTFEEARKLVAEDGAALVSGPTSLDEVIEYGKGFLGEDCARVSRQFAVSKEPSTYRTNVERGVPDERGRMVPKMREQGSQLWVHNDGKTFGDYSPEYLFLWMERAAYEGGASILVDGLGLLKLLATEPEYAELVEFCWNTPIDVSEAHFQLPEYSTIAREAPKGGYQVRCHYNLRAVPGPDEEKHQALIDQWVALVRETDETGHTFRLETGDVAIVDNYRLLHGRRSYPDPERRLVSTWGWTHQAFGVPAGQPDFNRPEEVVMAS